jgi:hypothetical protein
LLKKVLVFCCYLKKKTRVVDLYTLTSQVASERPSALSAMPSLNQLIAEVFRTKLDQAVHYAYCTMTAETPEKIVPGGYLVYEMAMYLMENDLKQLWKEACTNALRLSEFFSAVRKYASQHISFTEVDELRAAELCVAAYRGFVARRAHRKTQTQRPVCADIC